MSDFNLEPFFQFPDPLEAESDGLLAQGGDLSPEMLLSAYLQGVFPWFDEFQPLLWWSPDPRFVLFPSNFKLSKSLKKKILSGYFQVKFDNNFKSVIENCSAISRKGQKGTWITNGMINAYIRLFELGYAHSVETYYDGKLVGGLYGLSLGKVFCGESMFHFMSDASKVAFYYLVKHIQSHGFELIDAQVPTNHLKQFGAKEMSRQDFLNFIKRNISLEILW